MMIRGTEREHGSGRFLHAMCKVGENQAFVWGGHDDDDVFDDIYMLTIAGTSSKVSCGQRSSFLIAHSSWVYVIKTDIMNGLSFG